MKPAVLKQLKYLTLLGVVATLISVGIASAQRNSFIVTDGNGKEVINYQESHALVIWARNYQHWGKLNNVENEANDVKRALEKQGFQVTVVGNPNGNELRNKIKEFIDNHGYIRNNRLVIFFAGHGHTRQETKGYLVPVDAPDPTIDERGFLRAALPMRQIITWAELMEAKHALFVFDSCFSGTIFKQRSQSNVTNNYIQDVMNKPVRQFLTAGDADEKVPAKSVFTPLFIRAIEGEADLYEDSYVTGTELGLFMRQNLSVYTKQQTPQFGTIRDPYLDQGDIVFRLPNSTIISTNSPPSSTKPITEITPTRVNLGLEQLLADKRWLEANNKTWKKLGEEGDKNNSGYLETYEIEELSCNSLEEINELWEKYSNGKYGFKQQSDIYKQAHYKIEGYNKSNIETYTNFAKSLGWYVDNQWLNTRSFNQSNSPDGFFPIWFSSTKQFEKNPFGLPENPNNAQLKLLNDPVAVWGSPGTALVKKIDSCFL